MCQKCGCQPRKVCGAPIEDGVYSGCWEPAEDCVCESDDDDQPEDWWVDLKCLKL